MDGFSGSGFTTCEVAPVAGCSTNASIGRAMFFVKIEDAKFGERHIEATVHVIPYERETQIPPGGHSAWRRATTFTASPCRSVPSAIASPMLMPTRKRMARSG